MAKIDTNLKVIGNKIVVEFIPDEVTSGGITIPRHDHSHTQLVKAKVYFLGTEVREELSVGDVVLVNTFAGAANIPFNDKTLRLYDMQDVVALLTGDIVVDMY